MEREHKSEEPIKDRYNDDEERVETGEALKLLPPDHPAHLAFKLGAGPIALTHIVGREHGELIERLKRVYLEGWGRTMQRGGFRPG